jgi:hypothetical protein
MRTRQECLEKAAHCEHLAWQSHAPVNRHLLLQTAQHWRSLAGVAQLNSLDASRKPGRLSPLEEAMLAGRLADVGCLIR